MRASTFRCVIVFVVVDPLGLKQSDSPMQNGRGYPPKTLRQISSIAECMSRGLVCADLEICSKLHALDVPHDNGYLGSLRGFVEQCHLAQVVCGLGSGLACSCSIWLVLEAGMPLWDVGLLGLLVHRAEEVLLLA
jgi:hypothetical protein